MLRDLTLFLNSNSQNYDLVKCVLILNCCLLSPPPVPTTPENLNVLVSSSTSLNVTWDPPSSLNAPTVSYIVRYRNASNAILVPGLVETELFIGGLEPFMEYSVSVQACSTEGCSDFTLEVVRVTGEAG